ncbi:hypothetical protein BUALT_Bualt11G0127100 [Buddleja alternifolia]|uniref:ELM2 domain-containing protein n=1 Tax=Buddleja alternifolia TaxID=168488 RepID=A0AAV6X1S0_9LAMI|nr:hypothetical protein BUALT_Bualt11G0127100 [Buddleja alternifolia]
MTSQQKGIGKKNVKPSLSKGVENIPKKSIVGRYSEEEMLTRLKGLARNPCNPQLARDNIRPLQNQILRLRNVMVLKDSQIPSRKRKLEQLVKDKLRDASDFLVPSERNSKKPSKRELSNSSLLSCLLNSVDSSECHYKKTLLDSRSSKSLMTFDDTFTEKHTSLLDDLVNWDNPGKDISPIVDSDESVNDSNASSPKNVAPNEVLSLENNNAFRYLRLDKPKKRHFKPHKRDFLDDHLQIKVIPIGPHFQANIPGWSSSVNKNILMDAYNSDFDNSKWLGTRTWPIENGNMKTTGRTIGKGRPNSCYCVSPGSLDCVRRHILEKRLLLQCDLGPAFFRWKFDEMGEQVSKLWSLKEQEAFESFVKRPSCNGNNFLKHALNCFPNKNRSEIIGYYFNVYIPYRVSLQARSVSSKQIDTDDEDEENEDFIENMGLRKTFDERSLIVNSFKDVQARFMCRAS